MSGKRSKRACVTAVGADNVPGRLRPRRCSGRKYKKKCDQGRKRDPAEQLWKELRTAHAAKEIPTSLLRIDKMAARMRNSLPFASPKVSSSARGPRMAEPHEPAHWRTDPRGWIDEHRLTYCAELRRCLSGNGLRACGLIAVSSTGVVPVTSALKSAPAGTR